MTSKDIPHYVYKIMDSKTSELLYIGETTNINRRMSGHEHISQERNAIYTTCDSLELGKTLECLLISTLKPRLNKAVIDDIPNVYNFDIDNIQWLMYVPRGKTIPDCDRYLVTNKETGEEMPIELFVKLINEWSGNQREEKLKLLESIAYLAQGKRESENENNMGDAERWNHMLERDLDNLDELNYG